MESHYDRIANAEENMNHSTVAETRGIISPGSLANCKAVIC